MKVDFINLKDIGGIPSLTLNNLDPKMNIICGENGVGKTNILDALAYVFSQNDNNVLNKRAGSIVGKITLNLDSFDEPLITDVHEFEPSTYTRSRHNFSHLLDPTQIIYLKVNRVFDYYYQESIGRVDRTNYRISTHTKGVDNKDLKEWFVHRILLRNTPEAINESERKNIEKAIECFSILDENIKFKTVNKFNEIIVNTPTGDIFFEYLSSGFKSTLFIVLGIIKELDYRFFDSHINYLDFKGLILIDEVELHLHPEWQGKIAKILKDTFPNAQFFITTHSPHIIQSSLQNEVIALERKDGEVERRNLPNSKYGYQGWTIEEILEDVMGMPDLRTKMYNHIKKTFDDALDLLDKKKAQEAFNELDKMLHPQYPLRQLFKMQLDSLGE
ncbi:AAA family ATPase [Acinetobacter oleivorans]|uniref:AAA family ATPase n=1 Tax=Acinetobacter oleivorans TaxID=1148157 RepID=UPI003A8444FC